MNNWNKLSKDILDFHKKNQIHLNLVICQTILPRMLLSGSHFTPYFVIFYPIFGNILPHIWLYFTPYFGNKQAPFFRVEY